jgi:hypothetical protein
MTLVYFEILDLKYLRLWLVCPGFSALSVASTTSRRRKKMVTMTKRKTRLA